MEARRRLDRARILLVVLALAAWTACSAADNASGGRALLDEWGNGHGQEVKPEPYSIPEFDPELQNVLYDIRASVRATRQRVMELNERTYAAELAEARRAREAGGVVPGETLLPGHVDAPDNVHVWFYSLVSVDYDGDRMLPHLVKHYLLYGIDKDRMMLVLNFNTHDRGALPHAVPALRRIASYLDGEGVGVTRLWLGQYSSEQHLGVKLETWLERVPNLHDWIVLADLDEFHVFPAPNVYDYVRQLDERGWNHVIGRMTDRVAESAQLEQVQDSPTIFEQFPLACRVTEHTTRGSTSKIPIFKAYVRPNQGNHHMVPPEMVSVYYGPHQPGEPSPRGGAQGGPDYAHLTPYFQYYLRYWGPESPEAEWETKWGLWPGSEEMQVATQHFKWHAGVAKSITDRLRFYKGDYNESDPTAAQPRYFHYVESERLYNHVVAGGGIDKAVNECGQRVENAWYVPPEAAQRVHQHAAASLLPEQESYDFEGAQQGGEEDGVEGVHWQQHGDQEEQGQWEQQPDGEEQGAEEEAPRGDDGQQSGWEWQAADVLDQQEEQGEGEAAEQQQHEAQQQQYYGDQAESEQQQQQQQQQALHMMVQEHYSHAEGEQQHAAHELHQRHHGHAGEQATAALDQQLDQQQHQHHGHAGEQQQQQHEHQHRGHSGEQQPDGEEQQLVGEAAQELEQDAQLIQELFEG